MVENKVCINQSEKFCEKCSGKGKTTLFRQDLEKYEEVECICQ